MHHSLNRVNLLHRLENLIVFFTYILMNGMVSENLKRMCFVFCSCCNATDYRYPSIPHSPSCSFSKSSSDRASINLYRFNSFPADYFLLHPIDNRPVLTENSPTENSKPLKKTRFNLKNLDNHDPLYDSDSGLDLLGFQSPTDRRTSRRKRNLTLDLGESVLDVVGSFSGAAVAYSNALTDPLNAIVHGSDYGASHSRSGSQQSPVMASATDTKRAQFSRSLSNADVQTDNITGTVAQNYTSSFFKSIFCVSRFWQFWKTKRRFVFFNRKCW